MKLVIKRRHALLVGAVLFAPGAWSLAPLAGPELRTETVKFNAAEAATAEGAASLHAKLREAAVRVCSEPAEFSSSPVRASEREACIEDALATAVRSVSIPMLSVMHSYAGRQPVVASR